MEAAKHEAEGRQITVARKANNFLKTKGRMLIRIIFYLLKISTAHAIV